MKNAVNKIVIIIAYNKSNNILLFLIIFLILNKNITTKIPITITDDNIWDKIIEDIDKARGIYFSFLPFNNSKKTIYYNRQKYESNRFSQCWSII